MTSTLIPDDETTEAPSESSSRANLPRPALLAIAGVVAIAVIGGGAYELTKGSSSPTPTTAATTAAAPATGGSTAAAKAPAVPAATILRTAMTNAQLQRGVHVTVRNVTKKASDRMVLDDGRTHGREHISSKGGQVSLRAAHGDIYVVGDEAALETMGFPSNIAALLGGRWISLTPGQAGYSVASRVATLPALMRVFRLRGPLRSLPARVIDGKHVVGVSGRVVVPRGIVVAKRFRNMHGTLWMSEGTGSLPVAFTEQAHGFKESVQFSNWGERFHVHTPDAI